MRDILVSCFSENAVNVISQYSSSSSSSFSCSSYSKNACISPTLTPSIQNSVSCVYKIVLSTQKHLLATVTWCNNNNNNNNQGFSITFEKENNPSSSFRLNTNSRFFRKKKGSRTLESEDLKIEIFWDLSNAKYDPSGPEPVEGFSVVIIIDSEIGLILGDVGQETVTKKFKTSPSMAKVSLISRREYCSGNTLYATKAKFCERGIWHDVVIKCSNNHGEEEEEEDEEKEEEEGLKLMKKKKMMMMMTCPPPYVMSVCIDKKTVIRVKRLKWNFRGNQTIFVDGLLVDLLWDVHDWFFNNPSNSNSSGNSGVFMFRTRSGLDSRLWLEEKNMAHRDKDLQFSFFIYACKNT